MVPVIISLLRSVPLGFLRISRCARCPWIPVFQFSSAQFSSVQFSFAFLCLLLNTQTNLQQTYQQLYQLISIFILSRLLQGQPTCFSAPFQPENKKQPKQPSTCLADLMTLPALSSPMRPSPQRERSALSSFASNKTMQVLRLDLCYEPACLRATM
jgi:hypothetical protein